MPSRYAKVKVQGKTISKHRYVWEQAHGPIPDGYQVHHKDHDRFNNDLSNLELVSTAEHGLRHSVHPRVKTCEVCVTEFTPTPTKRKRAKTCSWACRNELIRRASVERESARRREET